MEEEARRILREALVPTGAELGLQQDLFAGAAPRPHPKQDRLDTTLDAIRADLPATEPAHCAITI
jgi:hypothetical protein